MEVVDSRRNITRYSRVLLLGPGPACLFVAFVDLRREGLGLILVLAGLVLADLKNKMTTFTIGAFAAWKDYVRYQYT